MSAAAGGVDAAGAAAVEQFLDGLHLRHEDYQDPCLDLFLRVGADTPPQRFQQLLADAWARDNLTALKLFCKLCVGDAGKERFYAAAIWMHRNHPRTLAGNLSAFADFGFIKDFPELLYRLVVGAAAEEEAPPSARTDDDPAPAYAAAVSASLATRAGTDHAPWLASPTAAARKRARTDDDDDDSTSASPTVRARTGHDTAVSPATRAHTSPTARKTAELSGSVAHLVRVDDKVWPWNKYGDLAAKMYKDDPDYHFLFDSIAGFFSERLRSDHKHLQDGNTSKIGLTAKWCPKSDSAFDQTTLLSDAIAHRLSSGNSAPPLGDVLASLALQIQNVPQANKKAETKLPYEIIECLGWESTSDADASSRAVQEWENMLAEFREKKCLINSTAISDLPPGGGKFGRVAVALTLLILDLSSGVCKDKVFPFRDRSVRLRAKKLDNKTLIDKIDTLRKMECHSNFSLRKILEAMYKVAKEASSKICSPQTNKPQIEANDMVNTIFVFSGRDFDQAIEPAGPIRRDEDFDPALPRLWSDDYDIMVHKFAKIGYGEFMPQVVFWNLCGQRSAALTSVKDGVMHLSGYSDEFLRLFLEKGGVVYPEDEMYAAIAGEEYEKLKVIT